MLKDAEKFEYFLRNLIQEPHILKEIIFCLESLWKSRNLFSNAKKTSSLKLGEGLKDPFFLIFRLLAHDKPIHPEVSPNYSVEAQDTTSLQSSPSSPAKKGVETSHRKLN